MAYKPIKTLKDPTEKDFWTFVQERQNIYHRRFCEMEPPPWTDDLILQSYHFCNIFRSYDRGTKWAINNILNSSVGKRVFFNTVAYRCCNRIGTFERYGFPELDGRSINGFIRALENCDEQIFNAAYRASAFGSTPRLVIYKRILVAAKDIAKDLKQMRSIRYATSMKKVWEKIRVLPGVGPFIANEILLDLTYSEKFFSNSLSQDFVNVGPGALMGLELMYGKLTPIEAEIKIHVLKERQDKFLPKDFPVLKLSDVQFAMCEFRKYTALQNGGGKSRRFAPH